MKRVRNYTIAAAVCTVVNVLMLMCFRKYITDSVGYYYIFVTAAAPLLTLLMIARYRQGLRLKFVCSLLLLVCCITFATAVIIPVLNAFGIKSRVHPPGKAFAWGVIGGSGGFLVLILEDLTFALRTRRRPDVYPAPPENVRDSEIPYTLCNWYKENMRL